MLSFSLLAARARAVILLSLGYSTCFSLSLYLSPMFGDLVVLLERGARRSTECSILSWVLCDLSVSITKQRLHGEGKKKWKSQTKAFTDSTDGLATRVSLCCASTTYSRCSFWRKKNQKTNSVHIIQWSKITGCWDLFVLVALKEYSRLIVKTA